MSDHNGESVAVVSPPFPVEPTSMAAIVPPRIVSWLNPDELVAYNDPNVQREEDLT